MLKRGFFRNPGMFLSWELKDNHPAALVNRIADAGFKWIVHQYGDPVYWPGQYAVEMARETCWKRGLYWGGWSVGVNQELLEMNRPNFWVFNVETDYTDYSATLRSIRLRHPLLPLGVVTDCGLTPAPFIRYNVKCLPECYQQDPDPQNHTPERMVARAKELGWRVVFPVLGVYHNFPLSDYRRAGDGWSVYLEGGMQPADWDTARKWNSAQ